MMMMMMLLSELLYCCSEEGIKVGVNDFLIKATAIALQVIHLLFSR